MNSIPHNLFSTEEEAVQYLLSLNTVDPSRIMTVSGVSRVSFFEDHLDHQRFPVTGMAIDKNLWVVFAPRDDRIIRATSFAFGESYEFSLDNIETVDKS